MDNVKIKTLCQIRDINKLIADFEINFFKTYNLCLNEGMLLCTLNSQRFSSSEIADSLCLTYSNASKVIKSVEKKNLVKRILGKTDKRQMYFMLTTEGKKRLESIKCNEVNIPDSLKSIIQLK